MTDTDHTDLSLTLAMNRLSSPHPSLMVRVMSAVIWRRRAGSRERRKTGKMKEIRWGKIKKSKALNRNTGKEGRRGGRGNT